MLNPNKHIDAAAILGLEMLAQKMNGTNFALAMRNQEGYVTLYPREEQPCQGGEMRKYRYKGFSDKGYLGNELKETEGNFLHGDDCTRPTDSRPGDLCHPFPDGTPEGLAVRFYHHSDMDFAEFIFGKESPWRRGLPSPEHIRLLSCNGKCSGIVLTDLSVDPTVLVNLLQFRKTAANKDWKPFRDEGLSEINCIIAMMLDQYFGNCHSSGVGTTYNYYFPVNASIRRIVEGDPHDLTGGLYSDRYDYNRADIQDLFKAGPEEKATIFQKEMFAIKKKPIYSIKEYVEMVNQVVSEALSE